MSKSQRFLLKFKSLLRRGSMTSIGPTCVLVALAILAQGSGLGSRLDHRAQDFLTRLVPGTIPLPAENIPDVGVVTIDPRSLRANEDWPWSRSVHAMAVDKLMAAGARTIAFDIDFSSTSTADEDARFARSLTESGRVVLATFSQTQTLDGGLEIEIANRPIPMLEEAAAALGSVLVPIDPDGVVRNAPSYSRIGGESIPSLARSALIVARQPNQPASPARLEVDRPRPNLSSAADSTLDSGESTRYEILDFRRLHPTIPLVSFVDLIEGRHAPDVFAGRTVFIGATAAEFQDLWATPAQPALPGVLIQAVAYRTAAAEAAGMTTLRPARFEWIAAAFALLGLVTIPRAKQSGSARGVVFAGATLGIVIVGWTGLWHFGLLLPITIPTVFVAAQYALGIETLKRRIQSRASEQESSLNALAQLGHATNFGAGEETDGIETKDGLELAIDLLGEVVAARGITLLRAVSEAKFSDDRLEWRPEDRNRSGSTDRNQREPLPVDLDLARRSLTERKSLEVEVLAEENHEPNDDDGFGRGRGAKKSRSANAIYSPLVASADPIGVLVVHLDSDQELGLLHRRTIATVAAQLALTAQNLKLIDRLRETFESSIAAVAGAVEARDGYTDQHCRRLAAFSSLMGRRLGMPENEIRAMELGALLHDVGKIGIRDAILNKAGRLTDEERREMQRHPEIGAGIVGPVIGLETTTLHCVIHHHERWDGTGYPDGLSQDEIPLAARIVSIVDVWDALSTARPYKKAFPQAQVHDILAKGRGTQFDPELVDVFFEVLEEQGDEMLRLIARSSSNAAPVEVNR